MTKSKFKKLTIGLFLSVAVVAGSFGVGFTAYNLVKAEKDKQSISPVEMFYGSGVDAANEGVYLHSDKSYQTKIANVFYGSSSVEFTLDGSFDEWYNSGLALENIFDIRVASFVDPSVYFDIGFTYLDDENLYYRNSNNTVAKDVPERTTQKLSPILYYKQSTADGNDYMLKIRYSGKREIENSETDRKNSVDYGTEYNDWYVLANSSGQGCSGDFYEKATNCYCDVENTKVSFAWEGDVFCVYYFRGGERYRLAKFDDMEYGCGLPKLDVLKQGYTISFNGDCPWVSGFKRADDYTTTFDREYAAYRPFDNETNNLATNLGVTVGKITDGEDEYDLTASQIRVGAGYKEYTEYLKESGLAIKLETAYLDGVCVGQTVKLPNATYVKNNGETGVVTDITAKCGEKAVTVEKGEITVDEAGDYEILYRVGNVEKTLSFKAYDYSLPLPELFGGSNVDVKVKENCVSFAPTEKNYSADISGVFYGDSSFEFAFDLSTNKRGLNNPYNATVQSGDVLGAFRITDATDSSVYFDVVYYRSPSDTNAVSSAVCVAYRTENGTLYRGTAMSGSSGVATDDSSEITGYAPFAQGYLNKFSRVNLSFKYENGNLRVYSDYGKDNTKSQLVAEFDGSFNKDFAKCGFNSTSGAWGLPNLPFENGYKVSIASYKDGDAFNGKNVSPKINLYNVNGVEVGGCYGKEVTPETGVKIDGGIEKNGVAYVPHGGNASVKAFVKYAVAEGWTVEDVDDDSATILNTDKVGESAVTLSSEIVKRRFSSGKTVSVSQNVSVEKSYRVKFDTNGGVPIEDVVYSENTPEFLKIPKAYKNGCEFVSWRAGGYVFKDGGEKLIYGKSVTLVASWKKIDGLAVSLKSGLKSTYRAGEKLIMSIDDLYFGKNASEYKVEFELTDGSGVKKSYSNGSSAVLKSGEYTLKYVVSYSTDASSVSELTRKIYVSDKVAPTVCFSGNVVEKCITGSKIVLPDVVAYDLNGDKTESVKIVITHNGESVSAIDGKYFVASEEGLYEIKLYARDKNGLTGYSYYSVTAEADNEKPVIKADFNDVTVKVGDIVNIPTITVSDNADGNIVPVVKVYYGNETIDASDGYFTAAKAGIYVIRIDASDVSGNEATTVFFRITVR